MQQTIRLIALCLLAVTAGCAQGKTGVLPVQNAPPDKNTPAANGPPPSQVIVPPVINFGQRPYQVSLVPEDFACLPGKPVNITLSITNVSTAPFTITPFPPPIKVVPWLDWDQVLFSVAGGTKPRELKPNETATVNVTWDQKDTTGRQVVPGRYGVVFGELTIDQSGNGQTFAPRTTLLIKNPQGALEKTISPNQSQTANGITITLERVELTASGTIFRCFFVPPGYKPQPTGPGYPAESPPTADIVASAEFVAAGITKQAGSSGFNSRDNGIILVWGNDPALLDPIPADAKDLTFRITSLTERVPLSAPPVEVKGPWEFKIPLQ